MTWLYLVAAALSGIGLLFTVIDWGRGARGALGSLLFFSLGLMIAVGGLAWIHCSQSAAGCFPMVTSSAPVTTAPRAPVDDGGDGDGSGPESSSSADRSPGSTGGAPSRWPFPSKPFQIGFLLGVLGLATNLVTVGGFVFRYLRKVRRR